MLADARVDGNDKFRFRLSREDIPIKPRLRFAVMGNTDKEYMARSRYILSIWFALSTHYDPEWDGRWRNAHLLNESFNI